MSLFLLSFAHAAPSTPKVLVNTGALDAILHASPIVQATLAILVFLSILCWAVAWAKWKQFSQMEKANGPFSDRFWKASNLDALFEDFLTHKNSPLARVFKAGYLELQKLSEDSKTQPGSLHPSGLDNLERSLRKQVDQEIAAMESGMTLLASTGSTGPFIGLFGTVWGIMGSFQKIGATGSASLAVVAPGISEALVATAIGLAAAIPAVVIYNHFISRVRKHEMDLNNFSADFLNVVKRNFFKV
jgi:biopolymer transport protein TolQ